MDDHSRRLHPNLLALARALGRYQARLDADRRHDARTSDIGLGQVFVTAYGAQELDEIGENAVRSSSNYAGDRENPSDKAM